MKPLLVIIAILLCPVALDSYERVSERHDSSIDYVAFGDSQLCVEIAPGEYKPREGAYRARERLSYITKRKVERTITATASRRIVQRYIKDGRTGRKLVYQFPTTNPYVTVRQTSPSAPYEESFVTVELPGPDILPPGKDYIIEIGIEIPAHGQKEAHTFTNDTTPFDVVL